MKDVLKKNYEQKHTVLMKKNIKLDLYTIF